MFINFINFITAVNLLLTQTISKTTNIKILMVKLKSKQTKLIISCSAKSYLNEWELQSFGKHLTTVVT